MNCPEAQTWLQQYLDGEAGREPPEVTAHLSGCAECRQQHHAAQFLLEGLAKTPAPLPSPALASRVIVSLLAERRRQKRVRLTAGVAALAAVITLMVIGYISLPGPVEQQASRPNQVPDVEQPVQADASPLEQSATEARLAVASLAGRLARQSKEQAQLLWSATPPLEVPEIGNIPNVDELEVPLEQSLRETGRGMSQGVEVVAESARRAVRYFFQDLAPLEPKN